MQQWQMIAASVPGDSHLRRGMPCQDAYQVAELTGCGLSSGGIVVAVADGLGSAPCADRGAQVAVDAAVTTLCASAALTWPKRSVAWRKLLAHAFAAARHALTMIAAAEERPLTDYATTLLVAVVTKQWLTVGQVGDGAIVARLRTGTIVTVSRPQRGEYANETRPLTSQDALTKVAYVCRPYPVQALALFTDGVQSLCLDGAAGTPYTPFFTPLFAQICQPVNRLEAEGALIHFLQSDRLRKRSDDDKTLVLLGQVGAAPWLPAA